MTLGVWKKLFGRGDFGNHFNCPNGGIFFEALESRLLFSAGTGILPEVPAAFDASTAIHVAIEQPAVEKTAQSASTDILTDLPAMEFAPMAETVEAEDISLPSVYYLDPPSVDEPADTASPLDLPTGTSDLVDALSGSSDQATSQQNPSQDPASTLPSFKKDSGISLQDFFGSNGGAGTDDSASDDSQSSQDRLLNEYSEGSLLAGLETGPQADLDLVDMVRASDYDRFLWMSEGQPPDLRAEDLIRNPVDNNPFILTEGVDLLSGSQVWQKTPKYLPSRLPTLISPQATL